MKVQIKGFVTFKEEKWNDKNSHGFHFHESSGMTEYGYVNVTPATITVDVPDDFDPREKQIQILKGKKAQAMAEFQALVTKIDRQISELTAIEFEESGV